MLSNYNLMVIHQIEIIVNISTYMVGSIPNRTTGAYTMLAECIGE